MSKHETITVISPCESDLQAWTFQISSEDLAALAEKYGHTGTSVRCPAADIAEEIRDIYDTEALNATRIVDTPAGKIIAYPKHKVDCPVDFPGIFVDLVQPNGEKLLLACVEYDSGADDLMCCVYGDGLTDDPTDVRHYRNLDAEGGE